MNNEINYKSNPLHGVSLKNVLVELVDHYGFEILHAYLYINCFKTNPSIASSLKFLKKTDWARENVESFYLYEYKNLPKASAEQYLLPPRDRVIPEGQEPGEPAELSLEDAEHLREKRAKKSKNFRGGPAKRFAPKRDHSAARHETASTGQSDYEPTAPASSSVAGAVDPWAKARK